MKLIKMMGLAAVAAAVAMAFIGTSSASAFHRYVLCTTPAWWLCPAQNVITLLGRVLYPLIGISTFTNSVLKEECESGMIKGKETEENLEVEGGLEDTFESFTLSGCKPCTTAKVSVPITAKFDMAKEEEPEEKEHSWLMTLSKFSVSFEGCPLGTKCKFGIGEFKPKIEMGKEKQKFNTSGTKLKLEEGSEKLCGTSVEWNSVWWWVYTLHITFTEHVVWDSLYFL